MIVFSLRRMLLSSSVVWRRGNRSNNCANWCVTVQCKQGGGSCLAGSKRQVQCGGGGSLRVVLCLCHSHSSTATYSFYIPASHKAVALVAPSIHQSSDPATLAKALPCPRLAQATTFRSPRTRQMDGCFKSNMPTRPSRQLGKHSNTPLVRPANIYKCRSRPSL